MPLVPQHWLTFGGRASPLSGNPRLAGNPPNAMLNLAYAIGEAEARLSCLGMGLDPGLGVLHADQKSRDSLALDVLEAIRPEIDEHILKLLRNGIFTRHDVHELRNGQVRILPPLTHRIAESAPMWSGRLAPIVESVADAFAASSPSRSLFAPKLLSQANRAVAKGSVARMRRGSVPKALRACPGCGGPVRADNRWCDDCRPAEKLAGGEAALAVARAKRAALHAGGHDPSTSAGARAQNREWRIRRHAEELAWNASHPGRTDPADFRAEILPSIALVPVRQLAKATGLSVGYCAYVRRGVYVPHPRWWQAFRSAHRPAGKK